MEKNPKPMKDLKPVETNDNAADLFWKTHQAEYEARAKPREDRVHAVKNHNNACPKLQDELRKRRSISRVTTEKASRYYPIKIGACRKSTSRQYLKCNINFRRSDKIVKNSNKRTKTNKGTQREYLNKRKNVKTMIGTCPRCLSALKRKYEAPFRIKRSIEYIFTAKEFEKSLSVDDATSLKVAKTQGKPKEDEISVVSSNYPDTSDQTTVSYHSFASMDKEPMLD